VEDFSVYQRIIDTLLLMGQPSTQLILLLAIEDQKRD